MSKVFRYKPDIDTRVPPVVEPLRRVALIYQDKVTRGLKAMEEGGVLEKSDSSPGVSNMVIALRPNDEIRICGDLRNQNKAIIPDRYPLATMDALSEFFAGATVFSKIDLKWGYVQVDLANVYRYLTAMIMANGLYQ